MKQNSENKFSQQHSQLVKYIFQGLTIPQIAKNMYCSESCVSYHLKQLYEKYKVKTRSEFILSIVTEILENYKIQVFEKETQEEILNKENEKFKKIMSGLILNKNKSEHFEYWVQEARKYNVITY